MTDPAWTNTDEKKQQPPLWKQLMGAGVGMMVALGLYKGYNVAAPHVQAYLVPPGGFTRSAIDGEAAFANKEVTQEDDAFARVGARVRQQALAGIAARPDAAQNLQGEVVAEPEEVTVEETPPAAWVDQENLKFAAPAMQPVDTEESLATLRSLINEPARSGAPDAKGDVPGKGKPGPADPVPANPAPALPDSGVSEWLTAFMALGGALGTPAIRKKLFSLA